MNALSGPGKQAPKDDLDCLIEGLNHVMCFNLDYMQYVGYIRYAKGEQ